MVNHTLDDMQTKYNEGDKDEVRGDDDEDKIDDYVNQMLTTTTGITK